MEKNYLITTCLLILHQIDAAYWHEWEMFNLPGGIQGYLLFNIVAIPILLIGYRQVILANASAIAYSYLCGILGVVTCLIHLAFYWSGFEQFTLPLSIFILVLCFVSGCSQLVLTTQRKNN